MNEILHVFISGQVQGVGFRQSTYHEARKLGLLGWVRNLPDGRVEAVFEGPSDTLTQIRQWCETGPALASVDSVDATIEHHDDRFVDFEIRF